MKLFIHSQNFNSCSVGSLGMDNWFHPTMDVIRYPCWDWSLSMLVKRAPGIHLELNSQEILFIHNTHTSVVQLLYHCAQSTAVTVLCPVQNFPHYNAVIMSATASQITSLAIIYLTDPLFRCRSKKISKLHITGLCVGNSHVTSEFPAQRTSNAENVSIWWRHHANTVKVLDKWGHTKFGFLTDFRCTPRIAMAAWLVPIVMKGSPRFPYLLVNIWWNPYYWYSVRRIPQSGGIVAQWVKWCGGRSMFCCCFLLCQLIKQIWIVHGRALLT